MTLKTTSTFASILLFLALGLGFSACQPAGGKSTDPISQINGSENHGQMHGNAAPKANTPPSANDQPANGEVRIVIENFVFSPAEVTVSQGTKVTWVNKDEAPHTATSVDKKFNSGGLDTGDEYSFVFNEKGDYPYICTLHPQMKATIKVN